MQQLRFARCCLRASAATLALLALTLLSTDSALAQGIRYTASPATSWVRWDESAGLADTRFVGGTAGIGFGRYVGLRGYFLTKDDAMTNLSGLPLVDGLGQPFGDQPVDLRSYGAELSLGLGSGSLVPLLMGGGGVLRFDPVSGIKTKQIEVKYGGGLRAYLSEAIEAEFMVESSQFRLDRVSLAPLPGLGSPAHPVDPDADLVRRNLSFRAGLGIQLGSRNSQRSAELDRAFEERYTSPLRGLAIVVEPFAGIQQFDDQLDFGDRDLAGVRGGLDFGSFVGLRGFYWEGVNADRDGFEGLKGWGGEVQFNLNEGSGLSPFVVAGAGQLEFEQDFDSLPELIPADQKSLIVGAGVDLSFGSRLRLSATARDYIMSGQDFFGDPDLTTAATPDDLVHNWQFTGGLKFLVGGGRGIRLAAPEAPSAGTDRPEAAPDAREPEPQRAAEPETDPRVLESLARIEAAAERAEAAANRAEEASRERQAAPSASGVDTAGAPTGSAAAPATSPLTDLLRAGPFIIMPWPVMMPYAVPSVTMPQGWPGPAGMMPADSAGAVVSAQQVRELVRQELGAIPVDSAGRQVVVPGVSQADLESLEERLIASFQQTMQRQRLETEALAREEARAAAGAVVRERQIEAAPPATVDAPAASATARRLRLDPTLGYPVREIRPYTGFGFDDGTQMILGVAADWGPIRPGSSFDLIPEFSVAVGSGKPTWMGAANIQYRLPWVFERDRFWLNPLVQAGAGLLNRDDLQAVVNLLYGASFQVSRGRSAPLNFFLAHQGVDFFSRSNMIIGLSLER